MGLGKTVEIISLICGNPACESGSETPGQGQMPRSPATLIITPPAILKQWQSELERLAPSLKIFTYDGLRVEAEKHDHQELMHRLCHHDIVISTYPVLSKEIHYAEAPVRDLRHEKKYEKRLCPLTQIYWWRVVLDEAQMVESGVSNAAKVANLIPREIAWW